MAVGECWRCVDEFVSIERLGRVDQMKPAHLPVPRRTQRRTDQISFIREQKYSLSLRSNVDGCTILGLGHHVGGPKCFSRGRLQADQFPRLSATVDIFSLQPW